MGPKLKPTPVLPKSPSDKSKVYFLACAFPPFGRGNSITNGCIANGLADDFDVEVICMEREDGLFLTYQQDSSLVEQLTSKLTVKYVKGSAWFGVNELLYAVGLLPCYFANWAWSVWRQRRNLFREEGMILAVYPVFSNLVLGYLLGRVYGFPLVVDFRDDFSGVMSKGWRRVLGPWYRRMEAAILRQSGAVTVTTEALKDDLRSRHGIPVEKVSVVSNIVPEVGAADDDRPQQRTLTVIYAGALSRIQRPEILLQAYGTLTKRLPETSQLLRVEIYGPDNSYFSRKVRPHMVEGAVFGGFLPWQEVNARLAGADIGFLSLADSTYGYATPTKLFEYVELGLPVVGSLPQGAAREMIEENEIGLVADPGDIEGLAECLKRMSSDTLFREKCRANALVIREEFRPERQIAKWRDVLMQLAGERESSKISEGSGIDDSANAVPRRNPASAVAVGDLP